MKMATTIGDGIIAFAIAFAIVGIFFALAWSPSTERRDYEICITKCPQTFGGQFKDLECPKMCAELLDLEYTLSDNVGIDTCVLWKNWEGNRTEMLKPNNTYYNYSRFKCKGVLGTDKNQPLGCF